MPISSFDEFHYAFSLHLTIQFTRQTSRPSKVRYPAFLTAPHQPVAGAAQKDEGTLMKVI
jgi:hypothetical protein